MQSEDQREKIIKKSQESLRELWDTIKHTNLCITGVPKGKKRKTQKKIFKEVIAENLPNLMKNINEHIQEI